MATSGGARSGKARPIVDLPENALEFDHARIGDIVILASDVNALQVGTIVKMLGDALVALRIDDRNLRRRSPSARTRARLRSTTH